VDLDQRGLLDETLVVCLGEMGRTPQATSRWGRGHWSTLFPAVLAGGGIRGGVVYGRSDKDAALPVEHPTSPEDLAATILHALGIDPELRVRDVQGRPVPLVDGGRPLVKLFG
jgi:arylsulfatase A-like enzyme